MHPVAVSERLTASLGALGSVGDRWLQELPSILASLEADWSITLGAALHGGYAAYVAEALTRDGRHVVLKVVIPPGVDGFTPFGQELEALQLAQGDPYVALLRMDVLRRSLLLERLGRPLASMGWSTTQQMGALVSTAARGWRPVTTDRLPTGETKARWLASFVSTGWEDLGHPCSEAAIGRAIDYAAERIARFDRERAVLVHGDAHANNLLLVPGPPDGQLHFRLIDPEGLISEPAHDVGVALRDWNDELPTQASAETAIQRCQRMARMAGVDPEAAWQWAFIERVSTGLFLQRLGHLREARTYLELADRLAPVRPAWA